VVVAAKTRQPRKDDHTMRSNKKKGEKNSPLSTKIVCNTERDGKMEERLIGISSFEKLSSLVNPPCSTFPSRFLPSSLYPVNSARREQPAE